MEIRFVRKQGERDTIHVRRSDGTTASWVFPSYGDQLPHDLVHLVVEAAFGLADGFWGRVDAGVDVARINAEANRRGGADKYDGFGDDRRGVLLAEGVANAGWYREDLSDHELCAALASQWQNLGAPPPGIVNVTRVAQVRAVMDALRARWQGLLPRGTIVLEVKPSDPESTFAALCAGV